MPAYGDYDMPADVPYDIVDEIDDFEHTLLDDPAAVKGSREAARVKSAFHAAARSKRVAAKLARLARSRDRCTGEGKKFRGGRHKVPIVPWPKDVQHEAEPMGSIPSAIRASSSPSRDGESVRFQASERRGSTYALADFISERHSRRKAVS